MANGGSLDAGERRFGAEIIPRLQKKTYTPFVLSW
jgi:hypothetical protein